MKARGKFLHKFKLSKVNPISKPSGSHYLQAFITIKLLVETIHLPLHPSKKEHHQITDKNKDIIKFSKCTVPFKCKPVLK
jgi:hypothetical protein